MEPVWLASYPPGVPAEIDTGAHASLAEALEHAMRRHAGLPAFSNMGATLDYATLERLSRAFAAWLQGHLGLARGERVAIMMPNLLQYPVVLLGVLRAGLVAVNVNPLYTPRELEHQLRDSGAAVVVILENFAHVLEACIAQTPVRAVVTTRMGDLLGFPRSLLVNTVVRWVKKLVPPFRLEHAVRLPVALAAGARGSLRPAALGHDDIAFLQYTGGTTGVSKGAMLTHGNMLANVAQASAWLAPVLEERSEVVVTALPLYHIFAMMANCFTFMMLGAHNHLITNPRDIPAFVRSIARIRFTAITGVNTLFNALLDAPGFAAVDLGRLKVALAGGMALQRAVAERWRARTGVPLLEAYGLTEASPAVCINPLNAPEYTGSIGLPIPGTNCSIRAEDGSECAQGEPGELCVRGPQVMAGYWQRPEDTRGCFTADGYLRTGDVARMDERGYFFLVDRKKDVIIVSGFNVYPNEVEDVLAAHPAVAEVAAIGVPDQRSGEAVKVFVVRKDSALEPPALQAWCRERLTAYKVPRHVEFRPRLPKSNVGKILRNQLRDEEAAKDAS